MNATKGSINPLVSTVIPAQPPKTVSKFSAFISSSQHSRYKGIILILLWNVIIGATDGILQIAIYILILQDASHNKPANIPFKQSVYIIMGAFGSLSVIQMVFYPLSGLLADLKYGRYKMVTFGQILITLTFIIGAIVSIIIEIRETIASNILNVILFSTSVMVLMGFASFRSNAVHFGLDQLLDAPSQHLSLFLWWYVWTANIGEMFVKIMLALTICLNKRPQIVSGVIVLILAALTSSLLLISCCKHKWFYCELKTHNPYKLVYKVLKFVAKHKRPLMRSSLTYCDDITPGRMDFAKTLYGGPFTTEVVEDVKTFLRLILMIFLVSPVFYYTIPGKQLMPLYGLHMGENKPANSKCSFSWVVLESGNLEYMVTAVLIPPYVIFLRSFVIKLLRRILHRLIAGIVIMVVTIWVMTVLYGVALAYAHHRHLNITCLFTSEYRDNDNFTQTLDFSPPVLVLPNVLAGIGSPIVNMAILEFISAQSPHTMKGLLLGIFYNVEGFYTLLGCAAVPPFAYERLFSNTLECGFFYYVFNSLLGVVFVVVAIAAYKWYQYRQREDKPYDHRYVEDYYRKYASQGLEDTDEEVAANDGEANSNSIDYGTFRRT